ncbi:hypothetical protein D1872_212340 [compost metagenome]
MIRIDKLNGTAKRCSAPYSATNRTSRAITTVNPLIAIAPEEPLKDFSNALDLLSSSVKYWRKYEIKNRQ